MEIKYVTIKIPGYKNPQTIIEESQFRHLFETQGYSRKAFRDKLGIGPSKFNKSVWYYYTPEQIQQLKASKIRKGNLGERHTAWEDKFKAIEAFIPGFKDLFISNIHDNPQVVMEAIVKLNDLFFIAKRAAKPIKKYANQSLKRLGLPSIKLTASALEQKVKGVIQELGFECESQVMIEHKGNRYFYDLGVGNHLIEVDGKHHDFPDKYPGRDRLKDTIAKEHGYRLLRVGYTMINKQPIKLKKCLKNFLLKA